MVHGIGRGVGPRRRGISSQVIGTETARIAEPSDVDPGRLRRVIAASSVGTLSSGTTFFKSSGETAKNPLTESFTNRATHEVGRRR